VRLLSATVSPSRVLSAQDKIRQSVSREAMAEQGLADKAGSSPRGICEGLAQNPQPFGSTRRSPDLDFAVVTSVNRAGVGA